MTTLAQPPDAPKAPLRPLPFGEFIVLLALLFATVAFSIDAMLPLLSQMGRELSPVDPTRAQLVITIFVFGLGLGTFVAGPVSDRFGRKPVIMAGIALYMAAAVLAALSNSLTALLVARFLQGLGTAAPRVVGQALVRDLYAGRQMARVMSFAMTIFVLVPAVAPLLGAQIGGLFGWRAIFWSFLIFGVVSGTWLLLRQPETLPPAARRALNPAQLWTALAEIGSNRRVMLYLAAMSLSFAAMFVWLSSIALVFETSFDRGDQFPVWFAIVALLSAPASLFNARVVVRIGMQRLIVAGLIAQITMALILLGLLQAPLSQLGHFAAFIAFMTVHFFTIGLVFGNLNALALEPMGHIAGLAASVIGGVSTMAAALIAMPISRLTDGTPYPLALGVLFCAVMALGCMSLAYRQRQQ